MTGNVNLGTLMTTLGVDMSQLQVAEVRLKALDATAGSTFSQAGNAASSCASQMAKIVGVTLSIVGAYQLASKAVSSWYSLISGGISIVDNYQKKIISTSYILTTMSDVPAPDLSKAYMQWKGYMDWLYRESLRVDKMAASSAQDIFAVSTELAKKGVVAASEEQMNTIARLTDLMKAVTPGYMNFEQQARGEIMAMMEGTARMGAQTAQILSQIDPEFKKNIISAREQGTVLKYIESILPNIKQYTLDLMGTWDAVGASLKSAWSVINIRAFGDAHREVVGLATQLSNRLVDNGKLTLEGEAAAKALGVAWATAKSSVQDVLDYILNNSGKAVQGIVNIAGAVGSIAGAAIKATIGIAKLIDYLDDLSNSRIGMAIIGAGIGYYKGGLPGAVVGGLAGEAVSGEMGRQAERTKIREDLGTDSETSFWIQNYRRTSSKLGVQLQAQLGMQETLATAKEMNKTRLSPQEFAQLYPETLKPSEAPPVPKVRPFTGKDAAGGSDKSLESAEARVRSFIETMNQAAAAGAGDTEAVLQAWKQKQLQTLAELAAKGADITQAKVALNEAVAAKQRRLDDDFNNWYIQGMGRQYAALQASENKKLNEVQGNAEKTAKVYEVFALKRKELDDQVNTNTMNLFKGYLDTMAGLSPTLEGQVNLKRQSLELEIQLSRIALERQIRQEQINPELADQARSMEALVASAKRYNFELQNSKGLAAWATERARQAESRNTISDFLTSIEQGGASAFSQGFYATLARDQSGIQQLTQNLAKSFFEKIVQSNWTMLWDRLAKKAEPANPMVTGAQQAGQIVVQAGQTFGRGVIESAYQFASIVGRALPSGSGSGGNIPGLGGGSNIPGLGGGGIPVPSYAGGSTPGSVGGSGGEVGGSSDLGGINALMGQFATAVPLFAKGSSEFLPGSTTFASSGVPGLQAAAMSSQQSATVGMMSNIQLGLGAAGLGLGAVGLMTGSQGLVTAGMVLQMAAVALQIAILIMKATSILPGAAHGAILGGTYTPIKSFAAGAPRVSAPTLAWVGEGPSEEAVIPLQQGSVPVKLSGAGRQSMQFIDNSTITVGDQLPSEDKRWLERQLDKKREKIFSILRTGNRNFVSMRKR